MQLISRVALTTAASGIFLAGCYTLQPATGVAPTLVGTDMAFDINDVGRVALGGVMGPEISQIEGRLVNTDSSEYVVAVTGITMLRGGEQTWKGERVHLKTEYVSGLYERRLSRGRTIAAAAVGVGVIALLAGRSILGAGHPDDRPSVPDTSQSFRIPHP